MRTSTLLPALLLLCACGDPGDSGLDAEAGSPSQDQASPSDLGPLPGDGGSGGGLLLSVTDDETGEPLPSRVLVTAVAPTPPPHFDRNAQGQLTNGETGTGPDPGVIGSPEGVLLVSGLARVSVPPGTYDLFITHGPEWEAWQGRVSVGTGAPLRLDAPLRHSVDTGGWIAADLHVHTVKSFDSKLQIDSRVVSEVSVGVELIVTTEHNGLADLQPDVELLGYGALARAIVGDEFNFVEGHGGVYPMPVDPRAGDLGLAALKLDWDNARLVHSGAMFDYLHTLSTRPAVTINHPRLLPDLGYFTNLWWSPPMALPDAGRFDALEVLNGYTQTPPELSSLLRDWFFLLNTGTRVTALGSSDTHRLRDVRAGFPRSWLRMPTDRAADVTGDDLATAVRGGRALASNGPFALLTVDGAQVGDLLKNTTGRAIADVTIDAPAWIELDRVRVFVNGKLAVERVVTPGRRPVLHEAIPLKLPSGDAWVVVQAGGRKPLRADLIGEHGNGMVLPFAITNPVYIDGDGDGRFKPAFAWLPDADPGPIEPLDVRGGGPGPATTGDGLLDDVLGAGRPAAREVPQDCEPPLWTVPSTWVNP